MKVIFLDFDGVITTYRSGYRISNDKLSLLKQIIDNTDARIVVSSSWKRGYDNRDEFVKSLGYDEYHWFVRSIYDITDNDGAWRGDEIQRYLDAHNDIESYVILDDDSDFHDDQLFNFVQTDTYYGISEREVEFAINILNNEHVHNPIRLNLELITRWKNHCRGIKDNGNIEQLLKNYKYKVYDKD